jgi:hypothetical protein
MKWYQALRLSGGRDTGGFKQGGASYGAFKGADIAGKNHVDAAMNAAGEWNKMQHADQMDFLIKNGAPPSLIDAHRAAAPQTPTLPPSIMQLPNAPSLNGPHPGVNVAERFNAMATQQANRNAGAKAAGTMAHAQQVINPVATVNATRAVKDAALAKDGITDMGGGFKSMSNKYGTGSATFGQPPTPGPHVFDNGAPVDLAASLKREQAVKDGTLPSSSKLIVSDPNAAVSSETLKQNIAASVAAAVPGVAARREKDRSNQVAQYAANNVLQYGPDVMQKANTFVNTGGVATKIETPSGIAKVPAGESVPAKPFTAINLQDAMSGPKPGLLPNVNRPAAKTVAGMGDQKTNGPDYTQPAYPAAQAIADVKAKENAAKKLQADQETQWNNHLAMLDEFAKSKGYNATDADDETVGAGEGSAENPGQLRPNAAMAHIESKYPRSGVAFKQLGTNRGITHKELLDDMKRRAGFVQDQYTGRWQQPASKPKA